LGGGSDATANQIGSLQKKEKKEKKTLRGTSSDE
jgi:hypothetical protein